LNDQDRLIRGSFLRVDSADILSKKIFRSCYVFGKEGFLLKEGSYVSIKRRAEDRQQWRV
jgi:hypothetical protein